jgi:hypothetical protein
MVVAEADAGPLVAASARLSEGVADGLVGDSVDGLHPKTKAVARPATMTGNGTRVNIVHTSIAPKARREPANPLRAASIFLCVLQLRAIRSSYAGRLDLRAP